MLKKIVLLGAILITCLVPISSAAVHTTFWLYLEGSTFNPSDSFPSNDWLQESWIKSVNFVNGDTYTDYVWIINTDTADDAIGPYFFVWINDASLVHSIEVGEPDLYMGSSTPYTLSGVSSSTIVDSNTQSGDQNDPNPNKHQGQTGYWVRIQLDTVPHNNPKDYGNPYDGNFDPSKVDNYIRVPITYKLADTGDVSNLIFHYDAHSQDKDTGYHSNTPNSHDASTTIPEFSTIAIPIGVILGIMLVFQRKKRQA